MDLPARVVKLTALPGGPSERDRLLDTWLPVVVRWCARLGGPAVDAEDAAQDVLVIAFRRWERLHDTTQVSAWLFGITRRVLAQHRRRAWVRRWVPGLAVEPADRARAPSTLTEAAEIGVRVQGILERLPEVEREVLVLCLLEERSDREVSELLGVPHGTVKSRMRRARARFLALAAEQGIDVEEVRS